MLRERGTDTVPRGWTPGWAATPRASAAAVLQQACSHCLTALTCIQAACLLARQALGRAQTACHTVAATDVKEVVRQCCRCCRCFELVLPAATACGWDLSPLIWSLAAHGQGRYGSVCVRVEPMSLCLLCHPCTPHTQPLPRRGPPTARLPQPVHCSSRAILGPFRNKAA